MHFIQQVPVQKRVQEQLPSSKNEIQKDMSKKETSEVAIVSPPAVVVQESTKVNAIASNELEPTITNTLEEVEQDGYDEIPSAFECPPKLQGWVRKQGHVVKNWKMRYFVLNRGYLVYYADKSSNPPFGTNAKGQLCLAGFREKSMYEFSQHSTTQLSVSTAGEDPSIAGSSGRRRSSGFFSTDPQYRIHLVYVPGQVGQQVRMNKMTR